MFKTDFRSLLPIAILCCCVSCTRFPSLDAELSSAGFTIADSTPETVTLQGGRFPAKLRNGSGVAWIDGIPVQLPKPALCDSGKCWSLPGNGTGKVLRPLLFPSRRKAAVILLDPGHGGSDPGAVGQAGNQEKALNLSLALELKKMLEARSFKVTMTRTNDQSVELGSRGTLAAPHRADLFISLHHNSAPQNPKAEGIEVFVLQAQNSSEIVRSAAALPFAFAVMRKQREFTRSPGRGVKQARFRVLRDAECPAILIEAGFLSNPAEEARCADPVYRKKLAEAVTQAVLECVLL